MAEQGREGVPQEGQGAAGQPQPVQPNAVQQLAPVQPPAVELELQLPREWGRVVLRIYNERLAAGVGIAAGFGIGIAAFYTGNLDLALPAIRRAIERRDPDNPDQPADPQVGEGVREGSLLVPVIFYSQLGYQYFTSILNGPFLKACLQTELEKVGYKEPIDVSVEKWELPNLQEGGAGPLMGMMGEERVLGWLAELQISEKASIPSTAAGDSGIPEDVSSVAGVSTVASWEDVEEEETAGPSQAKRARLPQQPPAQVTPTAQQAELQEGPLKRLRARLLQHKDSPTAQQAELQEGPLKRLRARLLQHKDSPTAQTWLKACSCLERGEAMVTRGGYQEGEGVEHLLEGLVLMEFGAHTVVNTILYGQSRLHLDKPKLDQFTSTQLQANPDSTPCLLLQALQLPYGHSRQQAINHVIDVVLQHGETDPMYKHLAYMYCALGYTIWQTTRQPAPALSACASALMYKSDHLPTLFLTAECSWDVSVPQAIRQFHHFIHTAPTDHHAVPRAHYCLVTLYGQQDPSVHRDRILHHYNMAQQADRNRLPVSPPAPSWLTDPARRVYEQVMAQPHK
ncbi:Hypp5447 [Branchiostoma lanceolatum]|uniref:Hypp5447 protein n=1 Tax=Branchiostoma lanceolatum TaxID=7740 RepID=A0A8J9W2P5_BRALA|nr:Hypp5447 [Branchiostoma lanceolatum]